MFFYLFALFACADTPLTGEVKDGSGQPIEGVRVSVLGTECVAQSTSNGTFALKCPTKKGTIAFNKKGFIATQQSFDFLGRERFEIRPQTLVEIPPEPGLYIQQEGRYQSLSVASLVRTANRKGKEIQRQYCLQSETDSPTTIKSGAISLFSYQSKGWRLFRMDANRCAYSDTRKSSGRWVVGYRDKPALTMQPLGEAFSSHTAVLKSGHYFVAKWDGFFVPLKQGGDTYQGHWFRVDE